MTQQPQGTPAEPVHPTFPPAPTPGTPVFDANDGRALYPGTTPGVSYPPPAPTGGSGNAFQESFGGLGTDPMTPAQERNWAMLAHVIPLIAFVLSAGTLGFVASLVIYLMFKDRGPFVRAHAATSLNLQIIVGIGLLVSAILMLLLIGFLTYPLVCVFAVVIHAIAASKANKGEWYKAPLTPAFIS